jgi:aspartate/glutamate racemase
MESEVTIGVLNLDAVPERVGVEEDTPGCLRNDQTVDFRLKRETVRGATPQSNWADGGMVSNFVEAAKKLETRGVKAIAGDCGFISIYQKGITKAVSVPVVTSSLILVPLVYRMLAEDQKVGILTANATRLSDKQFNAVGWSVKDIPVVIKGWGDKEWDPALKADGVPTSELVKAALALVNENPKVGAIVIECSVMPRHAHAVQKAIGLPVFDITSAVRLVHSAVDPPDYSLE